MLTNSADRIFKAEMDERLTMLLEDIANMPRKDRTAMTQIVMELQSQLNQVDDKTFPEVITSIAKRYEAVQKIIGFGKQINDALEGAEMNEAGDDFAEGTGDEGGDDFDAEEAVDEGVEEDMEFDLADF